MTLYQQNKLHIKNLRESILTDIVCLLKRSGITRIEFNPEEEDVPIITFETDLDCVNTHVIALELINASMANTRDIVKFHLENADCPEQKFSSYDGENIYIEGLNEVLNTIENKLKNND